MWINIVIITKKFFGVYSIIRRIFWHLEVIPLNNTMGKDNIVRRKILFKIIYFVEMKEDKRIERHYYRYLNETKYMDNKTIFNI